MQLINQSTSLFSFRLKNAFSLFWFCSKEGHYATNTEGTVIRCPEALAKPEIFKSKADAALTTRAKKFSASCRASIKRLSSRVMYFSSDSSEDELSLLSSQSPSTYVTGGSQTRVKRKEIYFLMKQKDYKSALSLLRIALSRNADDIRLLSLRSKCYGKLGMSKEASIDAKQSYELLITQDVARNKCKGILLCKVYCNLASTQINANNLKEAFLTLTNARRHNEILSMEPGVNTSFMMNNNVAIKGLLRIIREKEKQDERDEVSTFLGGYKERYKIAGKGTRKQPSNNTPIVEVPAAAKKIKTTFPHYDPKGLTRLELVKESIMEKHQLNTLPDKTLNPFESYINLVGSRAKVERHSAPEATVQGGSKGVRFAPDDH